MRTQVIQVSVLTIMAVMAACLPTLSLAILGTANSYPRPSNPTCRDQNQGVMVAAVDDRLWDLTRLCGRRYRVRCAGGVPYPCRSSSASVVVNVVDYRPGRLSTTMQLSEQAFSQIASQNQGVISIDYSEV